MAYDQKCFDLAEAFLSDNPHIWTSARVEKLAQHIQIEIDDWLSYELANYEPPDPPGFEAGFAENH